MNIAVIEDGIVKNIIVADSIAVAEEITQLQCVEYTEDNPARIGLGYDGSTFEQPPVLDPRTLEFTPEELADFEAARAAEAASRA
jgi:hypothetical protein